MNEFRPGFRFSRLDGMVLLAGTFLTAWLGTKMPLAGFIVAFVVSHFFLFCNVFRIARAPELIWAAVFVALSLLTMETGRPGWIAAFVASLLLSAILVGIEMAKPSYHGVGWQKINPNLENQWRDSRGDAGK